MRIGITGHRPDKLWGYKIFTPPYYKLRSRISQILREEHCEDARSGMALGADIIFALSVLDLKKEGVDIKLHCDIPCLNHSSKWVNEWDVILYNKILESADEVKIVSEVEYQPWVMQKRNQYLVDRVDKLIAVYDGGEKGGTVNCIQYAKNKGVEIILINPNEIEVTK